MYYRLCSTQLRQRLLRISVRHHDQLYQYQQREHQILQALQECSGALEGAVQLLIVQDPPIAIPEFIATAMIKYSAISRAMPPI